MPFFLLACVSEPALTPEKRVEIEASISRHSATRDAAAQRRHDAMGLALSVVPGDKPCPIQVPTPASMGGPSSFNKMEDAMGALAGAHLLSTRVETLFDPTRLGAARGPLLAHLDGEEQAVRDTLADESALHDLAAVRRVEEKVQALGFLNYDLTVVARTLSSAMTVDSTTFAAGTMSARVLLYDYATQRIACASDVVAGSSGSLHVVRLNQGGVELPSMLSDAATVSRDLVNEATRAGIAALRAVEQPGVPPAASSP